jgi:DNA invertase Pin-like site-specific DNA recombinase
MEEKNKQTKEKLYCAIYTRVSTTEGLEQEFTSIDNQRESAESYIQSQKSEGWITLPDRYDDGGYSGADTNRPGINKLIADIKEGKINCVVVYKVDRLSRSLLDFSKLLELFEQNNVAFVSVTQHFNTNTSMGRLTLNILLSFAQFEREIISERTKDKMGAAKMRGKWIGGKPPLGYDLDKEHHKLIVNPQEAELVKKIFNTYLEKRSLMAVVYELNENGYRSKARVSPAGKRYGNMKFKMSGIQAILNNAYYIGKVSYRGQLYPGEQERIISDEVFQKIKEIRAENYKERGIAGTIKYIGLLSKILRCKACNSSMTYSYSKKGKHSYYYYICMNARKRGYQSCPTRSISANAIENKFMECLRKIAHHPKILKETWDTLPLQERIEIIKDIVRQVEYDTPDGIMAITLKHNDECHKFSARIDDLKHIPAHRKEIAIGQEPQIRQNLILAHHFNQVSIQKNWNLKDISDWIGIGHPRVCQIANMLNLAPRIQEEILFSEDGRLYGIPEYKLRDVTSEMEWDKQIKLWNSLLQAT